MTNEDIDEGIKERKSLGALKKDIKEINVCKL